jgi:hypothetical protein
MSARKQNGAVRVVVLGQLTQDLPQADRSLAVRMLNATDAGDRQVALNTIFGLGFLAAILLVVLPSSPVSPFSALPWLIGGAVLWAVLFVLVRRWAARRAEWLKGQVRQRPDLAELVSQANSTD